jgi:hypothetical protein
MSIRYKCEECGSVLTIKDELAGTKGRCPKCKAGFVVPTAGASVAGPDQRPAATVAASAEATAGASEPGLSDDDIESILEGKDAPVEKGAYRVALTDIDDDDDDDDDDAAPRSAPVAYDDDDEDEAEEPVSKGRRRPEKTPPPMPAVSVANVARELMARGERAGKVEKAAEERRGARPFGGDERGPGQEEGFTLQEKALYLAKVAGPVVGVVAVLALVYSWWYGRWQKGQLPGLAPVSGVVMLDGKPLARALVQFTPMLEEKNLSDTLKRGAGSSGYTDEQGQYILFYTTVRGAVKGNNRVRIEAFDSMGRQIVPSQYNLSSTLAREVKEGPNTFDFELDSEDSNVLGGKGQRPQPGAMQRLPPRSR